MDLNEDNVERCLQYSNSKERDVIKQFFTNPQSIDKKKKTVVFSTPSETGTSYFRIFEPMRVMWKHFREEANLVYTENLQPNHLKLADVIIMHRAGNLHSHFLSVTSMWPKTEIKPYIVHDVDDNEFNLPRTHPMREIWYMSQKDKMSIQSLKESQMILTTANKLCSTFKLMNNNVQIFRNMFDWDLPQWKLNKEEMKKEMLEEWFPTDDKIIIGWAGLTSHYEDIKRMHRILKVIHDRHPETHFVLAGMALKDTSVEIHFDDDNKPIFKEKAIEDESLLYKNRVKNLYSDFDEKRIKIFDALPLEMYGRFYTLFDISLAYIEHNAFNSCKSEIKVIEGIHYGVPTVFSNYGGYKDYWSLVPDHAKLKNMSVQTMLPKRWIESVDYWVNEYKKDRKSVEKSMEGLKAFTDNYYDLNEHVEERLYFLLEQAEKHEEDEVNRIAKNYGFVEEY